MSAGALTLMGARPALATRLMALATRPLPADLAGRIQSLAASFLTGLGALGGVGPTARVLALSCGAWLLEAGMYFTLMFAFPLAPSLALAVLTTAVANLGTLIPSSPGYVGVFDFLGQSVLVQFGVPQAPALAYVLVVHAAHIVPVSLLGLWYAWRAGVLGWVLGGGKAPPPSTQPRAAPRRRLPRAPRNHRRSHFLARLLAQIHHPRPSLPSLWENPLPLRERPRVRAP